MGGEMNRKRPGFTFLEVMIVVVILGILAAALVPNLAGASREARTARIRMDLSTIGAAVELYHAQHGAYPASLSQLAGENGEEGYIKSIPASPDKEAPYVLNASTGEVTCHYGSKTYSSYGTETGESVS
jgi:general secretion pathway protein G